MEVQSPMNSSTLPLVPHKTENMFFMEKFGGGGLLDKLLTQQKLFWQEMKEFNVFEKLDFAVRCGKDIV